MPFISFYVTQHNTSFAVILNSQYKRGKKDSTWNYRIMNFSILGIYPNTQIPFIIFIFCRIFEFIAIPNDKITKTKYRNGSKGIIEYQVFKIIVTRLEKRMENIYLL